jgi:hypothetical protein
MVRKGQTHVVGKPRMFFLFSKKKPDVHRADFDQAYRFLSSLRQVQALQNVRTQMGNTGRNTS